MLLEEIFKKKPHLYLDMDGVQADFFGAWAEIHNVPSFKHIHNPEIAIEQLAHSSEAEVYDFFLNLKPLTGGLILIHWLHKHEVPFTVLSAPLRGPFAHASIEAKKHWLDRYNPGTSKDAIFTADKHLYAMTDDEPNVLVDDVDRYLLPWEEAGGIAIKHYEETTGNTIRELWRIYVSDE